MNVLMCVCFISCGRNQEWVKVILKCQPPYLTQLHLLDSLNVRKEMYVSNPTCGSPVKKDDESTFKDKSLTFCDVATSTAQIKRGEAMCSVSVETQETLTLDPLKSNFVELYFYFLFIYFFCQKSYQIAVSLDFACICLIDVSCELLLYTWKCKLNYCSSKLPRKTQIWEQG